MHSENDGKRGHDGSLQEAFDEAAAGLEVELVEPEAEAEFAGAVVAAAVCSVEVKKPADPPKISNRDRREIRRLVKYWETLEVEHIHETWTRLCADPVGVFTLEGIAIIGEEDIRKGLESSGFKAKLEKYPPHSPRQVEIGPIRVVFMARTKAFAFYPLQETFANGENFAGNSVMMFLKDTQDEWKIGAYSQHIPKKDLQPTS